MGEYWRGFRVGLAHGTELEERRMETRMNDDNNPGVIAEADGIRLYSTGQVRAVNEVARYRLAEDVSTGGAFLHLLADAVRRLREEILGLREASDCQDITNMEGMNVLSELAADLDNRWNHLAERIEAVERAIQDTRVDQGEMGLVSESEEGNILVKIQGLVNRVAELESRQRDEAGPAKTPSDEGKTFPTAELEANARRTARVEALREAEEKIDNLISCAPCCTCAYCNTIRQAADAIAALREAEGEAGVESEAPHE